MVGAASIYSDRGEMCGRETKLLMSWDGTATARDSTAHTCRGANGFPWQFAATKVALEVVSRTFSHVTPHLCGTGRGPREFTRGRKGPTRR